MIEKTLPYEKIRRKIEYKSWESYSNLSGLALLGGPRVKTIWNVCYRNIFALQIYNVIFAFLPKTWKIFFYDKNFVSRAPWFEQK